MPVTPGITEGAQVPTSFRGLFKAIEDANFLRIKLSLDQGTDINIRNDEAEGALIAALRILDPTKRLAIFRWLLHAGASVITPDKTGRDAVIWAAYLNRTAEAKVALNAAITDIDVTRADKHSYTALHYAVFHNNPVTCHLLSALIHRFCLSPDIPDRHLVTPHLHALRLNHYACANAIKPRGLAAADKENIDTCAVWNKIGELQGIRLAKAKAKGDGRPGTSVSLPRGPRTTTPAQESGAPRHKTTRTQTLRRQTILGKSANELSRSLPALDTSQTGSKRKGTAGQFRTVSVKISELRPDVTTNTSTRNASAGSEGEARVMPLMKSSQPSPDLKHAYRNFIPTLFALYSDQQTGTVLPAASPRNETMSFGAMVQATKFAMLLKNKSRKGSSTTDSGSSGMLGAFRTAKRTSLVSAKK